MTLQQLLNADTSIYAILAGNASDENMPFVNAC